MAKSVFINQLQKGLVLEKEEFGLSSLKKSSDKNNNPYLDLELIDRTGTIKAKVWSDKLQQIGIDSLEEGTIIEISGSIGEFRGNLQVTVYDACESNNKDLSDFINTTTKDLDQMWEALEDRVDDIASERIKTVLAKLLELNEEEIRLSPAAKSIHHNYAGGLLEHIMEMLEISDSVTKLYPQAENDIVIAGIILHDIGKIRELATNGFQIEYSKEGKLLGHIVLGVKILNEINRQILSEEELIQLEHIILSHHFILEFGSPVTPRTIEAMIVSKLDDLSSKVRLVQKILSNNAESTSEFAAREFGIEGEVYLGPKSE